MAKKQIKKDVKKDTKKISNKKIQVKFLVNTRYNDVYYKIGDVVKLDSIKGIEQLVSIV